MAPPKKLAPPKTMEDRLADLERRMHAAELEHRDDQLRLWWEGVKNDLLQRQVQATGQKIQALAFVVDKFAQRTVQFGYVQRAITIATNNYFGILKTEATKGISWDAVLTFAVFTALPEYVALAGILKEIGGDDQFKKSSVVYALKSIGKTIDLVHRVDENARGEAKKINEYETANEVLKQASDLVLREQAVEAEVLQQLMQGLMDDSIGSLPLNAMWAFWNKAGLKKVDAKTADELQKNSDVLAELLLYDLLHAYTRKYVEIQISGSELDEDGAVEMLGDVTDNRVDINKFNDEQLKKIYDRFRVVPWNHIGRSPIQDWDDLALTWDAQIIYRPGKLFLKHYQTWKTPNERARARGRG